MDSKIQNEGYEGATLSDSATRINEGTPSILIFFSQFILYFESVHCIIQQ